MLSNFLHAFGFGLCHQMPARSFFGGGVQVPVCARDTGIYVGFVASLIVIAFLHRGERPRGFPRAAVWAILFVLVAFMGWDGITSYAGWRATTNALRLATGLGVGYAASAVVVPMLNDVLWALPSAGRVLEPEWRLIAWLLSVPIAWAAVWFGGPLLGVAYPVLVAICVIATLGAISLVIVAMTPRFDRKASRFRDLMLPIAVAVAVACGEVWLSGVLRETLVRLATRLT